MKSQIGSFELEIGNQRPCGMPEKYIKINKKKMKMIFFIVHFLSILIELIKIPQPKTRNLPEEYTVPGSITDLRYIEGLFLIYGNMITINFKIYKNCSII